MRRFLASVATVVLGTAGLVTVTALPATALPGDMVAPAITLTSPVSGSVHFVGDAVAADYSCSDGDSGVATCAGPVADGANIDTGSAGVKTFTVNATDNAGNPSTASASYQVLAKSPTTMGPTKVGGLVANSINLDGADVHVKVYAPVPNGGTLAVGDTFDVEWTMFKAHMFWNQLNIGPDPLQWTLPAPSNAVIDGPVTTSETDFFGHVRGDAHQGSASTGLLAVLPSANPSNASSIRVDWDDNSSPGAFKNGDGVIMRARYTVKVTAPGTVTVPGFPSVTGWDATPIAGPISSDPIPGPGVSFNAVAGGAASISISSPLHGDVFAPNAVVNADYACTGSLTCVGTVADGSPVDTSVSGPHIFTVDATASSGIPSSQSVTYYVTDPSVSVSGCTVNEGTNCNFAVTLSNPSNKTVTVDYATTDGSALAGTHYTAKSGTVTFAPGETSKQVSVATLSDGVYDPVDKTFTLDLSNPSAADLGVSSATGTVQNTTAAPLVIGQLGTITEGDSGTATVSVPVVLNDQWGNPQPAAVPVTVDWATHDYNAHAPGDYTAASGTLTFAPGETVKYVDVDVAGDTLSEPDELGLVILSNPVNGTLSGIGPGLGFFRIDDNEPRPAVSVPDASARSLMSLPRPMKFVVTLDRPIEDYAFVDVSTVDGTAVAGVDYTAVSTTLTFSPMATAREVWVWVLPGSSGGTFTLDASSPVNVTIGDGSGTGTIT